MTRAKIPAAREKNLRVTTSTRFPQHWVLLTREPASFWRENVIAVAILQVLARIRSCGKKYKSFIILLSGEGLTSFRINNRTTLVGEKK